MVEFISNYIVDWGIIAIFLFMFSNGFFSTPPSEIVLPLAGALSATGKVNFALIVFIALLGNYLGTTLLYVICYFKGKNWVIRLRNARCITRIKILNKNLPTVQTIEKLEEWFLSKGYWIVFAFRMVPFIRSIVSIPPGITKLHFGKFTLLTLSGLFIWDFMWIWVGRSVSTGFIEGNLIISIIFVMFLLVGIIIAGRSVKKWFSGSQ